MRKVIYVPTWGMKNLFFHSLVLMAISATAAVADSSTPPTREGFTPGTDPQSRYESQVDSACRTAPATVDTYRETHHRISQGVN
jgi:hypothetical protein